ncbi:MAG TPA: 4Fe-4S dicluster domain-containing protein [bacterium]
MCDSCAKHGDGGKWYENVANYAKKMYKIRKDESEASSAVSDVQMMVEGILEDAVKARGLNAPDYEEIKNKAEQMCYTIHFGQVITLDEVEKIMDIAYPIARMSCSCRRKTRGARDKDNFLCMGIGVGMYRWERWPETYRGGVEFMSPKKAREWLKHVNELGMVHTFWTFGTPYIGGICNCEYPVCIGIRNRLDYGVRILMKGEQIAQLASEKCNGCGICAQRCQFGAIRMEVSRGKANINQQVCFGCGLCLTACKPRAIEMAGRARMSGLKEVW